MTQVDERSSYLDADAGSLAGAARRLALAEDDHSPMPERVRVLADVGRFVDEFFQLSGSHEKAVRERVQLLLVRQSRAVRALQHEMPPSGVELCDVGRLSDDDQRALTATFLERIAPVLVPLVVEAGKPLPPPANLSLNVAVIVSDAGGRRRLGLVELPPIVPRFVRVRPRSGTAAPVVPVEQVVMTNLSLLFPGEEIQAGAVFRVTRRAGVVAAPGDDDMLSSVERQLRLGRHGPAVRLEVDTGAADEILKRLMEALDLAGDQVYAVEGLMGVVDLGSLPLTADHGETAVRFRSAARPRSDVFTRLDEADVLVHFPYEPYDDSVVALLDQASADPALLAIKQALYRPSPDGPTVRSLVRAAERGAHVVAVVELAARLDERNSVASARALERAGAHVVYGLVAMRTHCPVTLVIRDAGGRLSRYGVMGTGLQHPTRRPEGLALLSADPDLTADLADLFNYLTGYSRPARFRKLLVGPGLLRSRLLEMIRRETASGPAGRIALKVYRLVDREIIDALYGAAQRGVGVDLVVSGACALRPGLSGLSEGIRVVATVGRHFETSRVFAFGSGEGGSVFISSGDLGLALDRQVDVAAPIIDPVHRARLQATMEALVRFPAWEMDANGAWHRKGPGAEDALKRLAASAGDRSGRPR